MMPRLCCTAVSRFCFDINMTLRTTNIMTCPCGLSCFCSFNLFLVTSHPFPFSFIFPLANEIYFCIFLSKFATIIAQGCLTLNFKEGKLCSVEKKRQKLPTWRLVQKWLEKPLPNLQAERQVAKQQASQAPRREVAKAAVGKNLLPQRPANSFALKKVHRCVGFFLTEIFELRCFFARRRDFIGVLLRGGYAWKNYVLILKKAYCGGVIIFDPIVGRILFACGQT